MKKLNNWLSTTTLLNIYLFGASLVFTLVSILGLLVDLFEDAPFDFVKIFEVSFFMALFISIIFPLVVSTSRSSAKFFDIANPLKERIVKCNTKKEWDELYIELENLYVNPNRNMGILNEMITILKTKKSYMK